jgi:predicted transcriptional regulator
MDGQQTTGKDAAGKAPAPRKSGDTTRNANHGGRAPKPAVAYTDPTSSDSGATGVTPLLLSRLRDIFERVQSVEISGEMDMEKRAERLKLVGKEAHIIARTASALPSGQKQMVIDLADNVKAVVGALKAMTAEEVKRSVEQWQKRQAAKKKQQQEAAEGTAAADAAPAARTEPEAAPAPELPPMEAARERLKNWGSVLESGEFTGAPIPARQRTTAIASRDVQDTVKLLQSDASDTSDPALVDEVIELVDKLTDTIMAAKKATAMMVKIQPDAKPEEAAEAAAPADSFSVGALNEVLTDFHDALNAEHIMEVDAELRRTTVGAIISRLDEIEAELLPKLEGSEEVKRQARESVQGLRNRAKRIAAFDAAQTQE